MVTAEGAVARGRVRAAERARTMVDAAHGSTAKATGLIEASLATVARDLGAPWVDSQGHCLGLLVGGISEDSLGDDLPPDLQARPEPVASLAVPASVVALVWSMLQRHQSVPRSRMGLKARPAGEALRQHVCGGCGGQEITLVDEGGPAARAGIQAEDLLLALDGHPLRAGATLADELLPYRPMDTVVVTLVRHGERLQRSVVLAAR
jgi:putative serine protease PepD